MKERPSYNKELVQRIIQGDEEAFYAYKDQLFSYCYRFTKSEERAEEIVHDALLRVWTGRKTLDPERSFVDYFYTITRNLALNFLKKPATDKALSTCGKTEPLGIMTPNKACSVLIWSRLPEWQSVNSLPKCQLFPGVSHRRRLGQGSVAGRRGFL